MTQPSFDRFGPAIPDTPVVLSVPHAGRAYPAALMAQLAVPLATARLLEDRHVDAVALAALGGETMLVQRQARAWIDLNRREDERDPAAEAGMPAVTVGGMPAPAVEPSARVRAGLGLVPLRVGGRAELWRRRWTGGEVMARIVADHRPYHVAVADALGAAAARFGAAVLVDLHSMPPLPGRTPARIVIGDRHGASADGTAAAIIEAQVARIGLRSARNLPYAGGHIVERHGHPAFGVHAVQVEIDRSLYLDRSFDLPLADKVAWLARWLRAAIDALAQECRSGALTRPRPVTEPLAAE
ncbi:N-formylglutamate amidohydrolase [Sphingomonas bacterium]|uniref:N-formylglutamate amidohydrolase n=1 Tax=Sphingomonas bacterium TaxID=1895847 RepID=UPI0015759D10|nr:N-formylglutamate amidohydrolase [Sphingomonas bacterium]